MTLLFPMMVLLAGVAGMLWPAGFLWLSPGIVPLLGTAMFCMGITLKTADFRPVLRAPRLVLLGLAAQYIIMPGLAWLLANALHLSPALALGVILVGTAPGGTASNVMTYLARGDLALSVTLTGCSTLVSPVLTPALTLLLAGKDLQVDAGGMLLSILQIVFLPLAGGMIVNRFLQNLTRRLLPLAPPVSMLAIVLIVAAVVAMNSGRVAQIALVTALAVILHNTFGLLLGYATGRVARLAPAQRRTLALEVGLQNSGLAATLAKLHFPALPEAMLPAAFFSVWHNLSGAIAAAWWRAHTPPAGSEEQMLSPKS